MSLTETQIQNNATIILCLTDKLNIILSNASSTKKFSKQKKIFLTDSAKFATLIAVAKNPSEGGVTEWARLMGLGFKFDVNREVSDILFQEQSFVCPFSLRVNSEPMHYDNLIFKSLRLHPSTLKLI